MSQQLVVSNNSGQKLKENVTRDKRLTFSFNAKCCMGGKRI